MAAKIAMDEYEDMIGQSVRKGDTIAKGIRQGNNGVLRLYKVEDIYTYLAYSSARPVIKMKVSYYPDWDGVAHVGADNFVKVELP